MSPDEATRVIGYIRVSSEDQVREGVSLDVQEARIRDYCRAKHWHLMRVIRDEGRSAKDVKRPGLQEILQALPKKTRGWDGLVVVKLDRLTRSVRDLGNLMDAFKRARVGFTSIQESVDTSSASGELFFNLVASVSQWERRAIGERTQAAMSHLRRQGRRISRFAPYGQRIVAGRLVKDPKEQRVLQAIAELEGSGLSLRSTAKRLAARGHMNRSGHPFTPGTLARIVSKGPFGDSQKASWPRGSVQLWLPHRKGHGHAQRISAPRGGTPWGISSLLSNSPQSIQQSIQPPLVPRKSTAIPMPCRANRLPSLELRHLEYPGRRVGTGPSTSVG